MLHLFLNAQLALAAGPQFMRIYAYNSNTRGIQAVDGGFKITNSPSLFAFEQRDDKLIEFKTPRGKPLSIKSGKLQSGGQSAGWVFQSGPNRGDKDRRRFNHFRLVNNSRCLTQNGGKVEGKACDRSASKQLFNIQISRARSSADIVEDSQAGLAELYTQPRLIINPKKETQVAMREDEILTLELRRPARETRFIKVVDNTAQSKPEPKEKKASAKAVDAPPKIVPITKPKLVAVPPGTIPVQANAMPFMYSSPIVSSQPLYMQIPTSQPRRRRSIRRRRQAGSPDEAETGVSDPQESLENPESEESEDSRRGRKPGQRPRKGGLRRRYSGRRQPRGQSSDYESEPSSNQENEGAGGSGYRRPPAQQKSRYKRPLGQNSDYDRSGTSSKRPRPLQSRGQPDSKDPLSREEDYDDEESWPGRDDDIVEEEAIEKLRKRLHLKPRETRGRSRDNAGSNDMFERLLSELAHSKNGQRSSQGAGRSGKQSSNRGVNSQQYDGGSGNAFGGDSRNQPIGGAGPMSMNTGGQNQQNMVYGGQPGGSPQGQGGNRFVGGPQQSGNQGMGGSFPQPGGMSMGGAQQQPGNMKMGGMQQSGSRNMGGMQQSGSRNMGGMQQSGFGGNPAGGPVNMPPGGQSDRGSREGSNYHLSDSRDSSKARSSGGDSGRNASIKYDKSEISLGPDGPGGLSDSTEALNRALDTNNLDELIDLFEHKPSTIMNGAEDKGYGDSTKSRPKRKKGREGDSTEESSHGERHGGIKRTHGHIDASDKGIKIERIETKGFHSGAKYHD